MNSVMNVDVIGRIKDGHLPNTRRDYRYSSRGYVGARFHDRQKKMTATNYQDYALLLLSSWATGYGSGLIVLYLRQYGEKIVSSFF